MITKRFKNCVNNDGFTLIELLISLVLTLIVLGGVYQLYTSQTKAYSAQNQVAEMQQNVRIAMDVISRSIRSAGYDPTESDIFGFTNATFADSSLGGTAVPDANTIYLTLDNDGDGGILDNATEKIGYRLNGGNLQIMTDPTTAFPYTWSDLAENIFALTFTYTFDDTGTGLPDNGVAGDNIADVRIVQVSISARTSKKDHSWPHNDGYLVGYRTRTLTSNVRPRNY
jgi:type IV pilus assembly protein PilW